ncbi:MAG: hypothetical protein NTW03_20620 [Verrucomicrobia bacterium]|nr:hypothetical protein [Verrucomicrobiota bacterium]
MNIPQGWAMEGWIKPDALTGSQIIAHKGSDLPGGSPYWAIYLNLDVLRFEMVPAGGAGNYSTVISSRTLVAGQWQHIAVVADAIGGPVAGYHLYINGLLNRYADLVPPPMSDFRSLSNPA